MEDNAQKTKIIKIRFPEKDANELPLPYANALFVQSGVDDFFITIGSLLPPDIKTQEEYESFSEVYAKPLFRFATSRENIKRFIEALQQQYDNQTQAANDEG
jgi:hypothetical protein